MRQRLTSLLAAVALTFPVLVAAAAPAGAADVGPTVVFGGTDVPPSVEALLDAEVPSAEVLAAKNLAEAQISDDVALMLAEGLGAPAPDEHMVPVAADDGGGGGGGGQPSSLRLDVRGAYQSNNYRCVPAAGQTILQTMGISVSQDTLAREMYTNSNGTYWRNMPRPLNKRQSRNDYVYGTDTASAKQLLGRTIVDVKNARVALMIGIQMAAAPWYPSGRYVGSHAVAPYGYYTTDGGGLFLWDPWNEQVWGGSSNYGGRKKVALSGIWTANAQNNAVIVW